MAKSDEIASGIYKGWLAIVRTRLVISCVLLIMFGIFAICLFIWGLTSLRSAPPLQFPIPTPLK